MADLRMTSDGDIALKKSKIFEEKLTINFIVSKHNSINISFFIKDSVKEVQNNSTLNIKFNVKNNNMNFYDSIYIDKIESMKQKIESVILSSLGKSKDINYGSRLDTYNGKQVNEKNAKDISIILLQDISRSLNIESSDISINCIPKPIDSTYSIFISISNTLYEINRR